MNPIDIEILTSLAAAEAAMSSTELVDHCGSAPDRQAISRRLYTLCSSGAVVHAGDKPRVGSAPAAKTYRIGEAGIALLTTYAQSIRDTPCIEVPEADSEPSMPAEDAPEPQNETEPALMHDYSVAIPDDRTDEALAVLLDETDEAVLTYADRQLAGDAFWRRLRRMQEAALDALTTYRGAQHE